MTTTETIIGEKIFFNFVEINYSDISTDMQLVEKVRQKELDGFVTRGVFSENEVAEIRLAMSAIPEEEMFNVPTGQVFPLPFATLSNANEKLRDYKNKVDILNSLKHIPAISNMLNRLDTFFKKIAHPQEIKVPYIKNSTSFCAPGNFRIFSPDKGGLFVHCGYLFQKQAPFYYQIVEPMEMEGQLSYFLVLQNSDIGGELTIYDMLWKDIKEKDSMEENEYVLNAKKERLYLKDVQSFSVKPKPGDILVFSGGSIWHRVENIAGAKPRITFGGFLNFTPDGKGLRYWG